MIRTVKIPTKQIVDWNSFHATLKEALAFPDFYGRNGNAFIDCLTYDDDQMSIEASSAGWAFSHRTPGFRRLLCSLPGAI
jgi:RNAse (barnase) inhibitor barstar